jgi:N-acetylneuraminate epimerase
MRLLLAFFAAFAGAHAAAGEWARLPSLPDRQGFAGSFAGVSRGTLLVAGGANFPGKKPWEGGKKAWSDAAFALERPDGNWKVAGRLPRPTAYGVSATHRDGVVCAGGGDAERNFADAFRLEWEAGRLAVAPLPDLPGPLANACGALVGDTLYVAGGQERPDSREALAAAWAIDLAATQPSWRAIDPIPGPGRILATAAAFDGAFWVIGGASLVPGEGGKVDRRYLRDAYRHNPRRGWERVADLPQPVAAAPSPAPSGAWGLALLGGDDGAQVGSPPQQHRGFLKGILRYDLKSGGWVESGEAPAPRVTAPVARWGESWVIPSGEARPGIRSPEVWSFAPGNQE